MTGPCRLWTGLSRSVHLLPGGHLIELKSIFDCPRAHLAYTGTSALLVSLLLEG
jgi:hypothetical protein